MSELKQCPFCGSGALYETRRNGYLDETPTMFCNSCKAVVTWEQVEEEGVNDETKSFVREHWNTRAEYHGFEDAAVDAWKRIKAYQERTCKTVNVNGYAFRFECSLCGYVAIVHNCEVRLDELPNYCPNCGAKVVSE